MWDLPIAVEIDGVEYKITNKCDYRMVLDVICALNDNELDDEQKVKTALYVFYEDIRHCPNLEKAIKEMYKIISYVTINNQGEILMKKNYKSIACPECKLLYRLTPLQ